MFNSDTTSHNQILLLTESTEEVQRV